MTPSSPGGGTKTNNADGEWNGNTLTALSGGPEGTTGAFGAVGYIGLFPVGSVFMFDFDFSPHELF